MMIMEGAQEGLLDDSAVLCIHDTIDPVKLSDSIRSDASPDHDTSSPTLDHLLHVLVQKLLHNPSLDPLPPI